MDLLWYVGLIFVCLVGSAFFSGSETALLRLRAHEVDADVEAARGPAALAARDLLRSTSRLLVTILLGNNVTNIMGSAVAAALFIHLLGEGTGVVVATLVMTVLVLVFCEVLPKALAAHHPRGVAYTVSLPLYLFHALMRPLHVLFDRMLDPFIRRVVGGEPSDYQNAEEIMRMARLAQAEEEAPTPLAIIGAAAGAAERTVAEIMVPRTEIVAFPADTAPTELLEDLLEESYTRAPIYEEDIDHILGIVHLRDLIRLVRGEKSNGGIQSILKPVLRVPERKEILPLLEDMQRAFCHLALVKDEFGVTLGMVTQEDILEEIVGEIRDEFDREELLAIRELPGGDYQALGRVKVLDFNRQSGCDVPAEPGDTLSGLVFNALGRAPRRGDVVLVPGYELSVADMSGTRIVRVLVRKKDEDEAEEVSNTGT